jgi:hypothetical protein
MNVEIGAEAAQFPEKEFINGIAVAAQPGQATWRVGSKVYVCLSSVRGWGGGFQIVGVGRDGGTAPF